MNICTLGGTSMRTLAGHRHAVRAVAYAPGPAPLLASAGDDRSIRLWDPVAGQEVAFLENRRDGLLCLAFAPDGSLLAAGGRAGSITVWDVQRRSREPGTSVSVGPVAALSFTGDSRAVLAALRSQRYGGEPGRLLCWNLRPLHPLQSLDWEGDVESAAINPTRDLLAIAGQYRGVELWEIGRRRQEPAFWLPSRVRGLCFSPGQGRLLAVAGGRVVQVWDLDHRAWVASCEGHRGDVLALAFAPDGRLLVSGGMDRTVRLWETVSGRQLASWDWQVGAVHAVAFAPDGMTAAAGGDKPQVVVWDVDDG
jgi:WD40 repeat protein